jgi:predicted transcriptional regulator
MNCPLAKENLMTSQEFRTLRLKVDVTQLDWARMCRCARSHVANIENGQCDPGIFLAERARAIAKRITRQREAYAKELLNGAH